MAGTPGPPPDSLSAIERLATEPHRFSLFAALRLLEQAHPERPRLAESRKAADDAVRLGHAAHLSFAPSDVVSVTRAEGDGLLHLEQYSFGLFGPNGALPLHLTEQAYERRRHQEDATLIDFLNLFHHRLISLFYRAWANSDPATSFDRPESDAFVTYVGALIGMAPGSAHDRDAVHDYAKLGRAGHFSQLTRSAEGLESILADYFGLPFAIRPFSGSWLPIPDSMYCRLGGDPESGRLGASATMGASTWQCQHKFEIVLGPLELSTFNNFLPGARGLAEMHALVRRYTNDEWTWQLRLLLRDVQVPGVALGRAGRLGWTTWLGGRKVTADDVLIQEARASA